MTTTTILGALGLLVTVGDTIRLFARAGDHSPIARLVWGLWALGLVAPLAWAARDRSRAGNYIALGYVMAILALGVIEFSIPK